jgi:hypothetical protein
MMRYGEIFFRKPESATRGFYRWYRFGMAHADALALSRELRGRGFEVALRWYDSSQDAIAAPYQGSA